MQTCSYVRRFRRAARDCASPSNEFAQERPREFSRLCAWKMFPSFLPPLPSSSPTTGSIGRPPHALNVTCGVSQQLWMIVLAANFLERACDAYDSFDTIARVRDSRLRLLV